MEITNLINEMKLLIGKFEQEYDKGIERKERVEALEQELANSKDKITSLKEELENLKSQYYAIKGQKPVVYSVQVYPYEEIVEESGLFSTKTVEIGYKYQLFINDIPCFQPHKQPLKTVATKELNEAAVKLVCEQIRTAIPINSGIQLVGSLTDFSKRLLTLKASGKTK